MKYFKRQSINPQGAMVSEKKASKEHTDILSPEKSM